MKLLGRLWNWLSGRSEAAMDRLETPDDKVRLILTQARSQARQMHEAITNVLTEEKLLERRLEQARARELEWEGRALLAMREQRDDLAQGAALEKLQAAEEAEQHESKLGVMRQQTRQLKSQWAEMKKRLEDLERDASLKAARLQTARVQDKIMNTIESGSDGAGVSNAFDKLEDEIQRLEAKSAARGELTGKRHDLGEQFAGLERNQRAQALLLQLQKKSAANAPTRSQIAVTGVEDAELVDARTLKNG